MAMRPLFQDSANPKPQLQAWGRGSALKELSRREAGPKKVSGGSMGSSQSSGYGPWSW